MKRYILLVIALVVLVAFAGCKSALDDTRETTHTTEVVDTIEPTQSTGTTQSVEELREEAKKKRANTIHSIEVLSTAKNDENIYKVNYPWSYFAFDKENMICNKLDLANPIEVELLDSTDYEYIMSYIDSIPSNIGNYEGDQSFMLRVEYYDETGELQRKYASGFDEFPEGWDEFVCYVNNLCGYDYLCSEGEIVGVTPEFLTEIFGIKDEDLKIGTLADVIETNELDWYDITLSTFDMQVEINRYYEATLNPIIEPYRPTSIKIVDSTMQEYDDFSASFLAMIGDGWKECDSDQRDLRRYRNVETGNDIYLGRSADLPGMDVWVPTEKHTEKYCELQLDYGMEGMIYNADFYYSKNGKFILVIPRDYYVDYTDMILEYIELE